MDIEEVPVGACLRGGHRDHRCLSGWAMHGTASLMNPSESPAAASELYAAGGPGQLFGAGGPLGIRVQAERPSVACILRAVERRTR